VARDPERHVGQRSCAGVEAGVGLEVGRQQDRVVVRSASTGHNEEHRFGVCVRAEETNPAYWNFMPETWPDGPDARTWEPQETIRSTADCAAATAT
jgi:hypothetical protein